MQVTQISVTVGRTQNTGNFNSLRHDVTATATLDDGEDREEAVAALTEALKLDVRKYMFEAKETYAEDWPASPR